jgi:hypothetical protein
VIEQSIVCKYYTLQLQGIIYNVLLGECWDHIKEMYATIMLGNTFIDGCLLDCSAM